MNFPIKLVGRHSLKSWGYRLKILKGDFGETTDWKNWSPEMSTYCKQDVKITYDLYQKIKAKDYSEKAIELEHQFAEYIWLQEQHGFCFNVAANIILGNSLSSK